MRFVDEAGAELFPEDRRETAPLVWFGGDAPISDSASVELTTRYTPDRQRQRPARLRRGRPRPGLRRRRAGHRRGAHRGRRRPRRRVPHPAVRDDAVTLTAGTPVDLRFEIELGAPRGLPGRRAVVPVRHRARRRGPRRADRRGCAAAAARRRRARRGRHQLDGRVRGLRPRHAGPPRPAGRPGAAVAAANPRTVVLVNAGSPVLMPWRDEVAAVLVGLLRRAGVRRRGRRRAARRRRARRPAAHHLGCAGRRRARALDDARRRRARLHRGHPHRLPRVAQARRRAGVRVRPRPRLHRHRRDRRVGPGAVGGDEVVTLTVSLDNRATATASRSSRSTPSATGPRSTVRCAGSSASPPCGWRRGRARPSTSRSRPGCSPTGPTAGPTSRATTRCGSAPASSTCRFDTTLELTA